MNLLATLGADPANEVVVVSGRSRRDLEEWFGRLPVALMVEHGVWLRQRRGMAHVENHHDPSGRSGCAQFCSSMWIRLPGALLEEKEFSLAWHYRRADPEQGPLRAKELLDDLAGYTRNIDVQVLEGNKVIEIRNTGVNKGTAAMEWLTGHPPEFILSIGDDWTDEDLFRALPPTAYSVRVDSLPPPRGII